MTLLSYLEAIDWFKNNLKDRLARRTIESYVRDAKRYFLTQSKPINEITKEDAINYLLLPEIMKLQISSRKTLQCRLYAFFQALIEGEVVKYNPFCDIERPKVPIRVPQRLKSEVIYELYEAAKGNLRDFAIFKVLEDTGVRPSELIAIKIKDIDWDNQKIIIRKGKGDKERPVPYTLKCGEIMKKYLSTRNDDCEYLFITQYKKGFSQVRYSPLARTFAKYKKVLNINNISSCKFRTTLAMDLSDNGASINIIAELLGHEDLDTTRIYTGRILPKEGR